ncbi:MAG: oligosaccharide flippase family protein [Planctomycetota bacterium]
MAESARSLRPMGSPTAAGSETGPIRSVGAMGRTVGRGLSWLLLASLVVKLASLGNQAVLGWVLAEDDFGVFGAAIGVAALVNVLREGGVRRILIQKGAHRFDGLIGPVYAIAVLLNLLAAGVLVALGPVLARYHDNPEYVPVMGTLGAAAAIFAPALIYRAKLAMDFRYKAIAALNTASSIVRYATMIALALAGAGPLTFTVSLVAVALFEWAFGLAVTRDPLIRLRVKRRLWPAILARTKWLIAGALALALLRQGDFLVLGFLLDERILGVYVFAYMLGEQAHALIATNLQQVLMPAMAAFNRDAGRHAASVLRASRALAVAASVLAGGVTVGIAPLEQLIWQGKWQDAVPAVQIISLCFALRLLVSVQESALSSSGRFRLQFVALLAQGLGMVATAVLAGSLFPDDPAAIAACIGGFFVFGVTAVSAWSVGRLGVPVAEFLRSVLAPWGTVAIIAVAAVTVDAYLANALVELAPPGGGLAGWLHPAGRLLAIGGVFGLATALALRVLFPGILADVLNVAPARVAALARRVLVLPSARM